MLPSFSSYRLAMNLRGADTLAIVMPDSRRLSPFSIVPAAEGIEMTQKQLLAWAVSGTLMFAGLGCANNCAQCSAHKHKDKEEHEEKVAVDSLPGVVVDGVKSSMPDG